MRGALLLRIALWAAGLGCLGGLAPGAVARADPDRGLGVIWRAPVGCPDQAEVTARIEQRLGRPIERAAHGIDVEIATGANGVGSWRGSTLAVSRRAPTVAC